MTITQRIRTIISTCILLTTVCTTSAFAAGSNYVGNGMENKRLAVYPPTFNNLSTAEQAVLTDLVSIIRMNLHDYAGFSIIDAQNMERITDLQAESEDDRYAASSTIRAGKLKYAEYEAFITVSSTGTSYSLGLSITNLETGVVFAEAMVSRIARLSDIEESAVQSLTAAIVPKMGIELTAMGTYFLNGENAGELSTEQEYTFTEEEVKNLQLSLDDFDRQLKQYTGSSSQVSQNAIAIQAELETQRQLTEQRLAMAQQKAARLERQRAQEQAERIAAAERSQAANDKIRTISAEVEQTAQQIRSRQFVSMTFGEQISTIEKEKKAYIDLKNRISSELDKLQKETEAEYARLYKDPDDVSNYEAIEIDTATGKPYAVPRNLLIADNKTLYASLKKEENENRERIQNAAEIQLDEILKDIAAKEKQLSKVQTINSLTTRDLLTVKQFDMDQKSWKATADIALYGNLRMTTQLNIGFNDLCQTIEGKTWSERDMNGENGRAVYNEYRDTAAAFESMFRMGTPFVYLEADIMVTPLSKEQPSSYKLTVFEYRLYYTTGNKLIRSWVPTQQSVTCQLKPAYDIRSKAEIAEKEAREQKKKTDAQLQARVDSYKKWTFGIHGSFSDLGNRVFAGGGIQTDLDFFHPFFLTMQMDVLVSPPLFKEQTVECMGNVLFGGGYYRYLPVEEPTAVSARLMLGATPNTGNGGTFTLNLNVGVEFGHLFPGEEDIGWERFITYNLSWNPTWGFSDKIDFGIGFLYP